MTAKGEAIRRSAGASPTIRDSSPARLQSLTATLLAAVALLAGLLFKAEPAAAAPDAEPVFGPELQGFD